MHRFGIGDRPSGFLCVSLSEQLTAAFELKPSEIQPNADLRVTCATADYSVQNAPYCDIMKLRIAGQQLMRLLYVRWFFRTH